MKHKDLASHYQLSVETVRRWPAEKRASAIADIQAGVKPQIMQLVGEVAAACYRATQYLDSHVEPDFFYTKTGGNFSVSYRKPGAAELTYLVEPFTNIDAANLSAALAKIEELCK